MCGICGSLYFDRGQPAGRGLLEQMTGTIAHRGPDGEGFYVSGPVALGHRRLAIIDLNRGAQPMCNEDRTVWIVFNGEIYNFKELTADLVAKGHRFSSSSDTETIIHAYEEYGVGCLDKLQGMFTFAIWDEKDGTLFLARDRVGIKPLYYYQDAKGLIFGSEIKAILADPRVPREVDPGAIDRFLSYLYLPGDKTLLTGIRKLEPGHYLLVRNGQTTLKQYWDLEFETASRSWRNIDEAAEELWSLLKNTVRGYMISDVPVGFLLSGGVDSTALLSCAVSETDKRISTFTIGFDGQEFADERPYARLAADRFGTDHHEITISAQQFSDFLPKYVSHMEEPVCEPPAVALYYVSKLAREYVKVVLSGEGGDEAFGGYQNYRNLLLVEQVKAAVGSCSGLLGGALRQASRFSGLQRLGKYAPLMTTPVQHYYNSRVSSPFSYFNREKSNLYREDFRNRVNGGGINGTFEDLFARVKSRRLLNQLLYVDTKTWLPDDLLVKADKITMANSLELRVPLLDHKVLEFAANLPVDFKVHRFQLKRVLKKAFERHVPAEILSRKKTGFPVPYAKWLAGPLSDQVHDILFSRESLDRGYFNKSAIQTLMDRAKAGAPVAKEVFSLLTLELWHRQFITHSPTNRTADSAAVAAAVS
ncbi:MAG: asparagine synthase (glutamine-hydrolyzing) [Chthoniobacterales bacterium]